MRQKQHSGLRILICSSDPLGRGLLTNLIRHLGNQPTAVATPEEVLDALEGPPFSALIIDSDAPGAAIFDAVKLIRFSGLGAPRLPVILITRNPGRGVALACDDAQIDVCLTKPIEPADLAAAIAEIASADRLRHWRR